ncbi:hypothetical protein [Pseudomonas sp. Marseille-QA0892]
MTLVRLLDHGGKVLGLLSLPRTIKLAELEMLRKLGAARMEVIA